MPEDKSELIPPAFISPVPINSDQYEAAYGDASSFDQVDLNTPVIEKVIGFRGEGKKAEITKYLQAATKREVNENNRDKRQTLEEGLRRRLEETLPGNSELAERIIEASKPYPEKVNQPYRLVGADILRAATLVASNVSFIAANDPESTEKARVSAQKALEHFATGNLFDLKLPPEKRDAGIDLLTLGRLEGIQNTVFKVRGLDPAKNHEVDDLLSSDIRHKVAEIVSKNF